MSVNREKLAQFQEAMTEYWQAHGRHHLLWRTTADAWRILLAEILLRKTTSAQATEVYTRLADFTPQYIKEMDQSLLADILKPLGIHHVRAVQLQHIVFDVVERGEAALGSDEFLRTLPGVGRYISNAVRCCAFGLPVPAMDTNMIRVMWRVFGWHSSLKRPREDRRLWEQAETLIPTSKPREFNWGVLDFGAAVCTYRKPKCNICPVSSICIYYSTTYLPIVGSL